MLAAMALHQIGASLLREAAHESPENIDEHLVITARPLLREPRRSAALIALHNVARMATTWSFDHLI
jgi:hypothetical protein